MSRQYSGVWQETSADGSTGLPIPNSTAQGSFLTADSLEPQARVDSPAQSQNTREQVCEFGAIIRACDKHLFAWPVNNALVSIQKETC